MAGLLSLAALSSCSLRIEERSGRTHYLGWVTLHTDSLTDPVFVSEERLGAALDLGPRGAAALVGKKSVSTVRPRTDSVTTVDHQTDGHLRVEHDEATYRAGERTKER